MAQPFFMVTSCTLYEGDLLEIVHYVCTDVATAREAADLIDQNPYGEALKALLIKVTRYVNCVAKEIVYRRIPNEHAKTNIDNPFWHREPTPSGIYMVVTNDGGQRIKLLTKNLTLAKRRHSLLLNRWNKGEHDYVELYEVPFNRPSFEGIPNSWEAFQLSVPPAALDKE